MAQPYVGEIRIFAGNFAPSGWAFCDGQLMPISENETLFQLIGTTYGGDGNTTFALPDLRGRIPVHQGSGFALAQSGGAEEITLTVNQIPAHSHALVATTATAATRDPLGNSPATASGDLYNDILDPIPLSAQVVVPTGGSQPHMNYQPYLCVNYIISLYGIFPSP